MVKKVRMFAEVKVPGQSFKGVKRVVVPNQSMSLREIVQRFIKKESLPLNKEGFYSEDHGDIEKINAEDFTEKVERINELKERVKKGEKAEKERLKKEGEERQKKYYADLQEAAGKELEKRQESTKPQGPANSPPN